jgi:hypothetical protein
VFTSAAPFADLEIELARVTEAGLEPETAERILGGTLAGILGK